MSEPKFSIIIPTFNRKIMLQRAVQSVLAQGYKNWELVIVDDGSTDGTDDIVRNFDSDRIIYKYQKNKGRSSARNLGLENSTGSYICFLDSDDELLPNYLEIFSDLIKDKKEGVYLTGVRLQNGSDLETYLPEREPKNLVTQCLKGTFNLMPFCFHKAIINKDPFHVDIYYGEDFQFLIPLILQHKVYINAIESCVVHQHSQRTINKVFFNVNDSFAQMEKSVLKTIDANIELLENYISIHQIKEIRRIKTHDFILAAAKRNLTEARKINNKQEGNRINSIVLAIQRIKGIIQSWIA